MGKKKKKYILGKEKEIEMQNDETVCFICGNEKHFPEICLRELKMIVNSRMSQLLWELLNCATQYNP